MDQNCASCKNVFSLPVGTANYRQKKGQTNFYCSADCAATGRLRWVTAPCQHCGDPVTRKKSHFNKEGTVFCSKKCSAALRTVEKAIGFGARTKGDLFASRANYQSARSSIQRMARTAFLNGNTHPSCIAPVGTRLCGYSKHVEVCHIKDVAEFPDDATLAEINSPANLYGLCPTHHWEFDNNMLDIPITYVSRHLLPFTAE